MSEKYVIITAGGVGTRMGTSSPKQFLELHDLPVIMHSIKAFTDHSTSIHLILVLPEDYIEEWNNLCSQYNFSAKHQVCTGGDTRFQSVKNGLKLIEGEGLVAIHDAVRPLVTPSLISRCFDDAEHYGNAIPVINPKDSVREVNNNDSKVVDREKLRLVQTPQVFKCSLIQKAYEQAYRPLFTDDASVLESLGVKIHLTEGEQSNIKLTTREDLLIAKALLGFRS